MLAGSEITKLTIEHAQELLAMAKNSRSSKTAPSLIEGLFLLLMCEKFSSLKTKNRC